MPGPALCALGKLAPPAPPQVVLPPKGATHVAAYMPGLDWADHETHGFVARCAISIQRHTHSFTCCKGGHAGNDADCRMLMPRPVQATTHVLPGSGALLVKRLSRQLVPFIAALMTAQPCNQAMYLASDQGRFSRRLELWEAAVKAGDTAAEQPQPLAMEAACWQACFDACKYATKPKLENLNAAIVATALVRAYLPGQGPHLPL